MLPSRRLLPHRDVLVASWAKSRCRITAPMLRSRYAEHQLLCHLPAPCLHAALERTQLPLGIDTRTFRAQSLEQLSGCPPRLFFKPRMQLAIDRRERVRAPTKAYRFRLLSCRGSYLASLPRRAQSGKELFEGVLRRPGRESEADLVTAAIPT